MSPNRRVVVRRGLWMSAWVAVAMAAGPGSAGPIQAGRVAGIQGGGSSELLIQNRDPSEIATMVTDLFNQKGGPPVTLVRTNVPADAAADLYLPEEPFLVNGGFAAIMSSDREIGAVLRSEWPASGAVATMNDSLPGSDVIVPFLARGHEGTVSLLSIQNTDVTAPVPIAIEVFAAGQTAPPVTASKFIGPGTSITVDLGKDPQFPALPADLVGYARIRAATPLAVQSIVDVENHKAAFGFEGLPLELAADTLFAPMVHAGVVLSSQAADVSLDSFISIVNPGSAPVQVAIRYAGVAGSCQELTYNHLPFTLAGHASALVTQAPGQALAESGVSPLPSGCTATALIAATGGTILAAVVDRQDGGLTAQAYSALAPSQGARTVLLPSVLRRHGDAGIDSAIQVMNLGDHATTASIVFWDSAGRLVEHCGGCSVSLLAGGGHLWRPADIPELADGMGGSARVSADQPLGVVVNEVSTLLAGDMSSYLGIGQALSAGAPDSRSSRTYAPLLLKQGDSSPPRPTRTPRAARTAPPASETPTPGLTRTETVTPGTPGTSTPTGPSPTSPATAPSGPTGIATGPGGTVTGTPTATAIPGPTYKGFLPNLGTEP